MPARKSAAARKTKVPAYKLRRRARERRAMVAALDKLCAGYVVVPGLGFTSEAR